MSRAIRRSVPGESSAPRSGPQHSPIIEAHAAILERIKQHDPEGAAEAMLRHLSQPRSGLEADLAASEPNELAPFCASTSRGQLPENGAAASKVPRREDDSRRPPVR
jgi:FCD domain